MAQQLSHYCLYPSQSILSSWTSAHLLTKPHSKDISTLEPLKLCFFHCECLPEFPHGIPFQVHLVLTCELLRNHSPVGHFFPGKEAQSQAVVFTLSPLFSSDDFWMSLNKTVFHLTSKTLHSLWWSPNTVIKAIDLELKSYVKLFTVIFQSQINLLSEGHHMFQMQGIIAEGDHFNHGHDMSTSSQLPLRKKKNSCTGERFILGQVKLHHHLNKSTPDHKAAHNNRVNFIYFFKKNLNSTVHLRGGVLCCNWLALWWLKQSLLLNSSG